MEQIKKERRRAGINKKKRNGKTQDLQREKKPTQTRMAREGGGVREWGWGGGGGGHNKKNEKPKKKKKV